MRSSTNRSGYLTGSSEAALRPGGTRRRPARRTPRRADRRTRAGSRPGRRGARSPIAGSVSGRRSPRSMPRSITWTTCSRRAATTVSRNGSPIAGLPAICEISARITGPNEVSVSPRIALRTTARSSSRVSPVASTAEVRRGQLEEQVEGECLLRRPAPVDRRLADPGPGRHGLEPEPGEAVLDEQVARRVEDRPVDPVAAGTTAWGGGGLGHPTDSTGPVVSPSSSVRRRPGRRTPG